jgi:hypothetical protein
MEIFYRQNVSDSERVMRMAIGALILFRGKGLKRIFFGAVPLLEGLAGFCPVYRLLGLNMSRKGPKFLPDPGVV